MLFMPLLPDEHAYSGLVRARYLSGQMHINDRRFFDLNQLPYHWLRSQVPLCSNLKSLIEKATNNSARQFELRLFHTPFSPWLLSLPDNISPKELVESGMRNNLEENPFSVDRRWKFCPICTNEEISQYGVSYWHSSHQSLGALTCSVHHTALFSHEKLRYLDFTLPSHWLANAIPLSCIQDWQKKWQPFIFAVTAKIQNDIQWPIKARNAINEYLNIEKKVTSKHKPQFIEHFKEMQIDLDGDCLSGLFKGLANERKNKTNILWVTLSGMNKSSSLRHPLYWLVIIFWLQDKIPELSNLYDIT
jgi:hypothetical protein